MQWKTVTDHVTLALEKNTSHVQGHVAVQAVSKLNTLLSCVSMASSWHGWYMKRTRPVIGVLDQTYVFLIYSFNYDVKSCIISNSNVTSTYFLNAI